MRDDADLMPSRTAFTIFRPFDRKGLILAVIQLLGGGAALAGGVLNLSAIFPDEILIAFGSISLYHLGLTILVYRFPEWIEVAG